MIMKIMMMIVNNNKNKKNNNRNVIEDGFPQSAPFFFI